MSSSVRFRKYLTALCLAFLLLSSCASKQRRADSDFRRELDIDHVIAWLPEDTETLLVANNPFWISDLQGDETAYPNHRISPQYLEEYFESRTLGLFGLEIKTLEKHFAHKKVLLAVEGSRNFRSPAGLGELPFEGCQIAVFEDQLADAPAEFMKDVLADNGKTDEIRGEKTVVFEQKLEQDTWTIHIAFPLKNVAIACTNRDFLEGVLERIHGSSGERALPETLPEWKFVDKSAMFWGLRHFRKGQTMEDPTSPFGGRLGANLPDEQAIGLIYESDPEKAQQAKLTYVSGDNENLRQVEERRFPSDSYPVGNSGLHARYQLVRPGVIRSTYDLEYSESVNWFFFVVMGDLGHAAFL